MPPIVSVVYQSVNILFLAIDYKTIFSSFTSPVIWGNGFDLALQTASQRSFKIYANVHRVTFKQYNVSLFFAKPSTIIYLTNQIMIQESGITEQWHTRLTRLDCRDFFSPNTRLGSLFTVNKKQEFVVQWLPWELSIEDLVNFPVNQVKDQDTTFDSCDGLIETYARFQICTMTMGLIHLSQKVTWRISRSQTEIDKSTVFNINAMETKQLNSTGSWWSKAVKSYFLLTWSFTRLTVWNLSSAIWSQ